MTKGRNDEEAKHLGEEMVWGAKRLGTLIGHV